MIWIYSCFQMHKCTEMHAYTAPRALVAYRVVWLLQICANLPTVAFSCTNALKCLLLHKLLGPRVVCLQQMCKSVPLLLSVAQMHWNAYNTSYASFGGLEWFVCNKCTNSSCFQMHKCMHWNAYCTTCFGGLGWFGCNKHANLPHCCFQLHKCNEMLTAPQAFGTYRVVCLQQMHKYVPLLLSVTQIHWIA